MDTRGKKHNLRRDLVDIPYYDWRAASKAYDRTDHMRSAWESNDKKKSKHDLRMVSREPLPSSSRSPIKNDDNVKNYTRRLKPPIKSDDRKQITNHHSPKDDWRRSHRWDLEEHANHSLKESKAFARTDHVRSAMESNDKMKSKHDLRTVSREPFPRSRRPIKNDDNVEDYTRSLKPMSERDGGESDDGKQKTNHHSRKDDSRRSHRRRSRSWSWSPPHGTRRQLGSNEGNMSATICASGRCSRGNSCSFLHEGDPSYEDSRRRIDRDSRDYPMRTGRSGGEYRRTVDLPCKFFEFGTCRNGDYCWFSHRGEEHKNCERSLRDERREQGQEFK